MNRAIKQLQPTTTIYIRFGADCCPNDIIVHTQEPICVPRGHKCPFIFTASFFGRLWRSSTMIRVAVSRFFKLSHARAHRPQLLRMSKIVPRRVPIVLYQNPLFHIFEWKNYNKHLSLSRSVSLSSSCRRSSIHLSWRRPRHRQRRRLCIAMKEISSVRSSWIIA